VYVLNVVDSGPLKFVRAEFATLSVVFTHVAVVARPRTSTENPSNSVLIASDVPLRVEVDPADGVLLHGAAAKAFGQDGMVLTDDYAPVQRLLTRTRR